MIAIENTRLLNELRESLQQQTATADVLKVISRSTFDLQTVLQTLVESAARLCDADRTNITREKNGAFYRAEGYGFSREFQDYVKDVPIKAERGSAFGRALLEGRAVHIPDVLADPEYTYLEGQRLGAYRTVLAVPMLREGIPIGVLSLTRSEVRPFTEQQINLATTFADQAAIAIENVRLFDEVQARTRELQEALEYQTATSDVLNVISRSPSDIQPVLDTIADTAGRLCEAYDVLIRLQDGQLLKGAAHRGPIAADFGPLPIGRGWAMGRAFVDRTPVHVHDLLAAADEFPDGQAMARRLGVRTILATPLMRENEAIGAIAVRRSEVRPFSDKQVALLQTFADQAVIAIENARLFEEVQARTRELQEALEYQTATSEVLSVISRAPSQLGSPCSRRSSKPLHAFAKQPLEPIRSRRVVPRGGEVVGALGWGEGFEEPADLLPKALDGPLGSLPEERLQFGKGVLDWIEVGTVGRQVEQDSACLFDQGSHVWTLVAR